jgi:hypothetical protein
MVLQISASQVAWIIGVNSGHLAKTALFLEHFYKDKMSNIAILVRFLSL